MRVPLVFLILHSPHTFRHCDLELCAFARFTGFPGGDAGDHKYVLRRENPCGLPYPYGEENFASGYKTPYDEGIGKTYAIFRSVEILVL
jgi:hypothetical protein